MRKRIGRSRRSYRGQLGGQRIFVHVVWGRGWKRYWRRQRRRRENAVRYLDTE